jgi:hypothetical protein
MALLSADEARDAVLKSGVTVVPNVNTLEQALAGKMFTGKKPDGTIWKIHKETEDGFSVSL